MSILLSNLFIVYISSLAARLNPRDRILDTNYKNYNNLFIVIALISLICVSGFRYKSGTDYDQYVETYEMISIAEELDEEDDDFGFTILCRALSNISEDPQIMFLATAAITNILIVLILTKYSVRFELSMWLYITTFVYYSTFNGLRQWMAASIIFAGTKYLLVDRSFKKYLPIVILASLFHESCLIMLVVYFIIDSKTFSKRNLMIVVGFMGAVFAYSIFVPILFRILEGTQYAHYFDIMQDTSNGIHPLRLLVYFAPIAMFCLFYKGLNPNEDIVIDRLLNMCIIGVLIMFLALKNVFYARLIFYFDLYYLLLIPRLVNIGDKSFNRFIYYSICISYFMFSYALLVTGESWIYPYTFKMTLF